jgi:hypothetical protein
VPPAPRPGHDRTTLERSSDLVEPVDLVDRQAQLARFNGSPDVLIDFVKNLADFRDSAGAEGDADIVRILDRKL